MRAHVPFIVLYLCILLIPHSQAASAKRKIRIWISRNPAPTDSQDKSPTTAAPITPQEITTALITSTKKVITTTMTPTSPIVTTLSTPETTQAVDSTSTAPLKGDQVVHNMIKDKKFLASLTESVRTYMDENCPQSIKQENNELKTRRKKDCITTLTSKENIVGLSCNIDIDDEEPETSRRNKGIDSEEAKRLVRLLSELNDT